LARVLILAYTNYHQDGRVKRNAEALTERGDQVDVICLAGGARGVSNGVSIIALELARYRGTSKGAYLASYLRFFAMASVVATRLSRGKPYDVVIVCTMPDAAVVCAIGPRLYGAKVVLDVHDTMPELYQDKFSGRRGLLGARLLMAEERASAWFANRVLAVHEPHRRRLVLAGIPASKLAVVMNLPDSRLFKPLPMRPAPLACKPLADGRREISAPTGSSARNGAWQSQAVPHTVGKVRTINQPTYSGSNGHFEPPAQFKLICHGTVTLRLGLDLAVRAVALVRETVPSVHLQIIGEGDFLPAIHELTRTLGLERHISFAPSLPVEQLPAMLAQASVGIVPNRASRATQLMLPAKLLEYATMGMAIIAARLRTIEYYFPNDAVHYFEPGDIRGLAGAIEELYRQPEKRLVLGRKAAEVAANLSWERQRQQLFAAIDSLLGAHTEPQSALAANENSLAGG
jgi:glycosyltransferase involved in cell wall biosynthesis